MSVSPKTLLRISLSTLALCSLASTSHARPYFGGGGHNGPDLNGPSIPIAVDRVMKKSDLEKAIEGCVLDIANEVAAQFTKVNVKFKNSEPIKMDAYEPAPHTTYTPVDGAFSLSLGANDPSTGGNISGAVTERAWNYKNGDKVESGVSLTIDIFDSRSTYQNGQYVNIGKGSISLYTYNVPFLSFDSIFGEASYDDWQRLVSQEIRVTNLRMYMPEKLSAAEPLYFNDRKTKGTVNLVKYVDCIKASIQGQE